MIENTIPRRLYRLVRAAEWHAAAVEGLYHGAAHDAADGFIHMSTADQVAGTADRYYQGLDDVILLTLDSQRLQGEIRMEPSTGGDLYPHLYGVIPLESVLEAERLRLTGDEVLDVPFLRGD
jgi:uncharacterized protein (DUF952 family)